MQTLLPSFCHYSTGNFIATKYLSLTSFVTKILSRDTALISSSINVPKKTVNISTSTMRQYHKCFNNITK